MRLFLLFFLLVSLSYATTESLRQQALKHGLKPIPENFQTLLEVLDQNSSTLSKAKIILGKKLFFDKNLSQDRDISCASCHNFDKGGTDGRPTAIGHKNQTNPFHLNTPTVLNAAFSKKYFWNGKSDTLPDQAKGPLQASFEMNSNPKLIQSRILEEEQYLPQFQAAFGSEEVTFERVVEAIGAYEKILLTRGRFDAFLEGDENALDKQELQGLSLYINKGCVNCHDGIGLGGQTLRKFPLLRHPFWSMKDRGSFKTLKKRYDDFLAMIAQKRSLFSMEFHNDQTSYTYLKQHLDTKTINLLKNGFFEYFEDNTSYSKMVSTGCNTCHNRDDYLIKKRSDDTTLESIAYPFENRGGFLGQQDKNRYFRVPLLRNITSTKPYFHNGGIQKLRDAISLMSNHQFGKPLTKQEVRDIEAFLHTVDGELVEYEIE